MDQPNRSRQASSTGLLVFVNSELGEARLRCAQLTKYVKEVTDLIEKSEHRDHFFEVAGHLIHGIPDTVLRLDNALDSAAMGVSRLDYDEVKNGLLPAKAEALENVLQDNRLRYLPRRSMENTMNAKTAAYFLNKIANISEKGQVPTRALQVLIAQLEGQDRTASTLAPKAALAFRNIARELTAQRNPSRLKLAGVLRRILADTMEMPSEQAQQQQGGCAECTGGCQQGQQQQQQAGVLQPLAGAGEQFQKRTPSISDADVEVINEMHEKNKDNFKG